MNSFLYLTPNDWKHSISWVPRHVSIDSFDDGCMKPALTASGAMSWLRWNVHFTVILTTV
jgi:hypothetical protein